MTRPAVLDEGTIPTQRRYSPRLVEFVRRLGEHGYRTCEAEAAVAKLGVAPRPSRDTIKRWLDPDREEAMRMARRKGNLPGPRPRVAWTWQRRLERMRTLRELGLSFTALAAVMNHDYGLELTESKVRGIFNDIVSEKTVRKLMGAKS